MNSDAGLFSENTIRHDIRKLDIELVESLSTSSAQFLKSISHWFFCLKRLNRANNKKSKILKSFRTFFFVFINKLTKQRKQFCAYHSSSLIPNNRLPSPAYYNDLNQIIKFELIIMKDPLLQPSN